jgi:hypothetical protein
MATEQKEITTSPWAPASAAGAIFFAESRQPGSIRFQRLLQLIHGGTKVQSRALYKM